MFSISAPCILAHINLRKEGPDECQEPAYDLKLKTEVDHSVIPLLLLDDTGIAEEVYSAFWNHEGDPRYLCIDSVKLHRSIENCGGKIAQVWDVETCRLKSFSFKPIEKNRAELTFSVSGKNMPGKVLAILMESLHEVISVDLICKQADMFEKTDSGEVAK